MTSAKNRELPPDALENLQNLRAVRQALGLSQKKLGEKIGVSRHVIENCENGRYTLLSENYSKLAEFFGWDKADPPPPRKLSAPLNPSPVTPKPKLSPPKSKTVTPPARATVKVTFTPESGLFRPCINVQFTEGMCYEIHDHANVADPFSLAVKQIRNSDGYIFRYEGMSGIHHVFREIRGKWIQTYTDAQLIGKYVKEVEA